MARYQQIGIKVDAPEALLEGPEEEAGYAAPRPAGVSTPAEGLMAGGAGSWEAIDG
jgi:hypothetical protein